VRTQPGVVPSASAVREHERHGGGVVAWKPRGIDVDVHFVFMMRSEVRRAGGSPILRTFEHGAFARTSR